MEPPFGKRFTLLQATLIHGGEQVCWDYFVDKITGSIDPTTIELKAPYLCDPICWKNALIRAPLPLGRTEKCFTKKPFRADILPVDVYVVRWINMYRSVGTRNSWASVSVSRSCVSARLIAEGEGCL